MIFNSLHLVQDGMGSPHNSMEAATDPLGFLISRAQLEQLGEGISRGLSILVGVCEDHL